MPQDAYYMKIAEVTALRGTCDRRQVGAVVVVDDRIVSAGFNGAPRGMPECDRAGHLLEHGHCVRTVHAEANALLEAGASALRRAARASRRVGGSLVTLYTTTSPCPGCMNLAINCHVQRIVYGVEYKDASHEVDRSAYAVDAARALGITMCFWALDAPEAG